MVGEGMSLFFFFFLLSAASVIPVLAMNTHYHVLCVCVCVVFCCCCCCFFGGSVLACGQLKSLGSSAEWQLATPVVTQHAGEGNAVERVPLSFLKSWPQEPVDVGAIA